MSSWVPASLCAVTMVAASCGGRDRPISLEPERVRPEPIAAINSVKLTIYMTDAAVAALEQFLGPGEVRREGHPLRLSIEGTPETYLMYWFGFADDPERPEYKVDDVRDELLVVKGFPIAVRHEYVRFLTGATIDYVDSPKEGAGFKIENPRGTLESIIATERRNDEMRQRLGSAAGK